MATNAGEIYVELEAKIGKLKSGLKQGEQAIEGYRKKLDNFVKAHGVAIAAGVAAFTGFVVKATKAASDLQETQAKFDTVFRGSTREAESFAQELQTGYLLSETASKQFLASIQDTLVPMGIARERATDLSAEVVKLAADLGSFNNVPTADVVRDLQSALVGNTETVKKYGIVLRATDIQQRALVETGKENVKQLTQAEKVQAAYNIILEGSADAQGDVARTSDSYANRVKFMQAQLENFMTTLGELTIGPMTSFVTALTNMTKRLNDSVNVIKNASTQFGGFGEVLKSVALEGLRGLAKLSSKLFFLYGKQMPDMEKAIDAQIDAWQSALDQQRASAESMIEDEKAKREAATETTTSLLANSETIAEDEQTKREEAQKAEKDALDLSEQWRQDRADAAKKRADEEQARQERIRDFFMLSTKQWTDFGIQTAHVMFTQFGQGVADMVLEGRQFSDVMKNIFKDMARAFISYVSQMIAKWLAFMALRAALGGGVRAFFQEGGLIREPSIITGLRSGRQALAGESGTEAVVPVGGAGAGSNISAEEMGTSFRGAGAGAGGGGMNLTINISGQFLEGSESKWHTMFRDKIIPEVRRFTMSSPTGPFNRRRGVT